MALDQRDTRTWIEIDSAAARHNVKTVRSLLDKKTALWAVVKSNAYGHGIFVFPKLLAQIGVDGFCVDSLLEGVRLREIGIKESILVLGPTLPHMFALARQHAITITISNFDALALLLKENDAPDFHIKIDTGMHRQGFYFNDLPKVIEKIKNQKSKIKNCLKGIYTHFASAKDLNYPTYTDLQFEQFLNGVALFTKAGFKNFVQHVAATGGMLMNKKYHLDAVRVGIGLYGLWPSKELEIQLPHIQLRPTLSWHTVVTEVKSIERGDYVGYNLVYRASRDSNIAILPVGYWHGFPLALSGVGEVLIRGERARVIGRVSMDMIAVDVGHIRACRFSDDVVLIGKQEKEFISAEEMARWAETYHHYEIVTRINPLIERIVA